MNWNKFYNTFYNIAKLIGLSFLIIGSIVLLFYKRSSIKKLLKIIQNKKDEVNATIQNINEDNKTIDKKLKEIQKNKKNITVSNKQYSKKELLGKLNEIFHN